METPHRLALCLLAVLTLCVGCGASQTAQYAHLSGRYEENQALYENRLANGERLNPMERYLLCDAYSNTRNYAKTFDCADKYEAALKEQVWSPLMNSDGTPLHRDVADLWRAQALLETGRGLEAVNTANKAQEKLGRPTALGGFSTGLYMKLLAVRGLAQASIKDFDGARKTLRDIAEMTCGFVNMVPCEGERSLALTLVNVSLGQYRAAAATSEASGMKTFWQINAALSLGAATFDKHLLPREFLRLKVLYETGKTAEAKAGYLALLNNPATRSNGEIWWNVNYDLGRIARAEGDGKLSVERLTGAVATIESQRANINTEAAKIGFIGDKQAVYSELVSLLVAQGRAPEAFEYVERAKSRALVDLLAERQSFSTQDQGSPAESLKLLASLEQKYVASGAKGDEQVRLRSALTNLAGELRQQAPELASLVTVTTAKAVDIQRLLAPDETLVEYYGSGDELYVFTVTRESVTSARLDGKGLEGDVRALREALGSVGSDAWRPLSASLYSRLVAPVPGALNKSRLIIVAHGALHYLPFNALFDGQRFLVDKVSVQLLPSASVMQFLAGRKPATARDMLLLGNPDLGNAAMDLPGAEAEARAIKAIWPNSTMLMRRAATKSALTRAGQLFRVIHVAAHGEFVSDQPLSSRLLLAPDGADNGQLTAGDLYGLRLNADLVTLSACETGMGKVLSGDDVVGLTRGFLYAGANSIVASLWPVSDDETKFLMTSFYGNLTRMPKADALRQAQLETKKRYPHPFFWSAFQLTGLGR